MTSALRLHDFLDSDLPVAELWAARLDGEVATLGRSFTPIDVPSNVLSRARSLRVALPARLIADRRTAAWVYGAIPRLPARIDACARTTARPSALLEFSGRVREVVIDESEISDFGGVSVTTGLRTVFDLLRDPYFDEESTLTVRRLAALCGVTRDDGERYLEGRSHLPHKAQPRARLAAALP